MKYNCKKLSVLFAAVMMFVLACPVTVLAAAEEEAGTPAVYATFWSLIPPVVAIVLALITKEVYSSLFLGILVGALLYSGGNFEGTVNHIFSGGMISVLSSGSNVGILVFLEAQPLLDAGQANTSRQELGQSWQPFCLEC